MRFLLSENSKKELFLFLKIKHKCQSLKELSSKLKIPAKTLSEWFYNKKRYIPEEMILKEIRNKLKILDKKENNWGNIKGGKKTYQIILEKYGKKEMKKRQIKGGKNSNKKRDENFLIDISNPLFLEFYGVLLGDGWIGRYTWKNTTINMVGISGHAKLDRQFLLYCKKNIKTLFDRDAYFKEKPKYNAIELQISHKQLLNTLNKKFGFPIGKKINLKISDVIYSLGYDKVRHTIRGIFDTDGSFYLDKTPVRNPYPCISIQMKAPVLINQLYNILIKQDFRVVYRENKNMITLKGRKQLNKWMDEIGSSNPKHLNKINALVAQSG
tara:strand:- start:104 stop:1081 length:978 start_codon:yes stop_codon:yes gene_type:complete